jgi:hypothetical protein
MLEHINLVINCAMSNVRFTQLHNINELSREMKNLRSSETGRIGDVVLKIFSIATVVILLLGAILLTVIVEVESVYKTDVLSEAGSARALILFHPSRDAGFSDDLSIALAEGLKASGFSVQRATLTSATPNKFDQYALIAIVSNTYWWTPDLPTIRYLDRAQFHGVNVIGVIGGGGATERSQQLLDDALRKTGANVIRTRSFWLWRPNDEARMIESNRQLALEMARQLGAEAGQKVIASNQKPK